MFVKIINKKNAHIFRETIYECGRASVEDKDDQVLVELEGCPLSMGKENVSVQCDKQELSIYFMNAQGKTIDSAHFEGKVRAGSNS